MFKKLLLSEYPYSGHKPTVSVPNQATQGGEQREECKDKGQKDPVCLGTNMTTFGGPISNCGIHPTVEWSCYQLQSYVVTATKK